jgi:hypothetical protein
MRHPETLPAVLQVAGSIGLAAPYLQSPLLEARDFGRLAGRGARP